MRECILNRYVFHDDYCEVLVIGGKYDGVSFKIDIDDVNKCKVYKWYAKLYGSVNRDRIYISNVKGMLLHRYIMDISDGCLIDHINGDSTDNRKGNLRECNIQQNAMNAKRENPDTISGCKGVYWNTHIKTPKWVAHIKINGKRKHLGYFENLQDAIDARMKAEDEYFGEYIRN